MSLTPLQRTLRARLAAYSKHAQTDARESTAPARAAFLEKFTLAVDPRNELPEPERRRRAVALKHAFFQRLALKSSRTRKKKSPATSRATGDKGSGRRGDHST